MANRFIYGSGGGIEMPPVLVEEENALPNPSRFNTLQPSYPGQKPQYQNTIAVKQWRESDPFFSDEGKRSWQRPLDTN